MGIATIRMDTAITRTDTTDLIDTPVIIQALRTIGPTGIEFTGTIAITITTIATKLDELARTRFRASSFFVRRVAATKR
jgi:hypothetical protein